MDEPAWPCSAEDCMIPQDLFQAVSCSQKINQPLPRINTPHSHFPVLVSPLLSALSFSPPKLYPLLPETDTVG